MTCCAADSKIVGIVGDYDKSYLLKENDKIKVVGEVGSSVIRDENNVDHKIPSIKIENLDIEN